MSADDDPREPAPIRSVAVGFLAMVPLFLAYEWAVAAADGSVRNAGELVLTRPLAFLASHEHGARRLVLLGVSIAALALCRKREWRVGGTLARTGAEGIVAAFLFGPVLMWIGSLFPDAVPRVGLPTGPPAELPSLDRGAFAVGAGAWEELVFRLGAYSLAWLAARHTARFFLAERGARISAEVFALAASALLFAAFHLEGMVSWLGRGGSPSTWRASPGGPSRASCSPASSACAASAWPPGPTVSSTSPRCSELARASSPARSILPPVRFFLGITGASGPRLRGGAAARPARRGPRGRPRGHGRRREGPRPRARRAGRRGRRARPRDTLDAWVGEGSAAHVRSFASDAVEAPPSSGTSLSGGVVLCPCSMGTLARVRAGFSSNLVERRRRRRVEGGGARSSSSRARRRCR